MSSNARAAGSMKSAIIRGSSPPGGPAWAPASGGLNSRYRCQFPSSNIAVLPPRVTNSGRPGPGIATRVKPPFSVWPAVTPPPRPNGPGSPAATVVVQR